LSVASNELGLLLERWHLAQCGEGQVVLLSGEPGIGKSRIPTEVDPSLRMTAFAALGEAAARVSRA